MLCSPTYPAVGWWNASGTVLRTLEPLPWVSKCGHFVLSLMLNQLFAVSYA